MATAKKTIAFIFISNLLFYLIVALLLIEQQARTLFVEASGLALNTHPNAVEKK
jgi:hypothetical protein